MLLPLEILTACAECAAPAGRHDALCDARWTLAPLPAAARHYTGPALRALPAALERRMVLTRDAAGRITGGVYTLPAAAALPALRPAACAACASMGAL